MELGFDFWPIQFIHVLPGTSMATELEIQIILNSRADG